MLSYRLSTLSNEYVAVHNICDIVYTLYTKDIEVGAVLFIDKSIGKGSIMNIIKYCMDFEHVIIVCNNISRQALTQLSNVSIWFEVLFEKDICFDKTKNILTSRYTKIEEAEILQLEKSQKSHRTKWPKMSIHDPMARYLGFRINDVVYAIDNDLYRLVVE